MTISRKLCMSCKVKAKPLFQFPKNHERLRTWLKILNKTSLLEEHTEVYIFNNARLCALHFEEKAFTSTLKTRLLLMAVPKSETQEGDNCAADILHSEQPLDPDTKDIPPKPSLKVSLDSNSGIVLSWNMSLFTDHANILRYQIFAYRETDGSVKTSHWEHVGDVQALPLPMSCTLAQFADKNRYYFTVRALDVYQRCGPFSDPVNIFYTKMVMWTAKK